jgi:hypothetical protein
MDHTSSSSYCIMVASSLKQGKNKFNTAPHAIHICDNDSHVLILIMLTDTTMVLRNIAR